MRAWYGPFVIAALPAACVAATLLCGTAAQSQPAPPPSGGQPASEEPKASTKSLNDIAPKSIVVDPCKAQNPPSYCGKN